MPGPLASWLALLLAILTGTSAGPGYVVLRLTVTNVKGPGQGMQVAEVTLRDPQGVLLPYSLCECPACTSPVAERAEKACDGSMSSKWFDWSVV